MNDAAEAQDYLTLLDWKRRVNDLYGSVRSNRDPEDAWRRWVATRDELFRSHPQSPLDDEQKGSFSGLDMYPYDPDLRVTGRVESVPHRRIPIATSGEQPYVFIDFGRVHFSLGARDLSLGIFWLEGYGGGIFLPFRDATNGKTTYGGGRYLLDTVKGSDLGGDAGTLTLDFNFAYNPSCSYAPEWVCPLAPPSNKLDVPIEAGERF